LDDQTKDEISDNTADIKNAQKVWVRDSERKKPCSTILGIYGKIILNWVLNKKGFTILTGFI
jgi:hypothetical protein